MENTDLNLYSKNLPSLESGSYEIKVTQTVHIGETIKETYQNTAAYEVESSGFHIREQIEQIFPENGSSGLYNHCIPHIIFSNKALPWERGETPWLALLVFREDETFTIKEESEIDERQSVYYQKDAFKKLKAEKLTILELPLDLFHRIAPTNMELKYLAHVREIQLCNSQSVQFLHEKGLKSTESYAPASSVILSNRLPGTGANTAVLVSLDGFNENQDKGSLPIQFAVLKKWSFQCDSSEEGFAAYLEQNINAGDYRLENKGGGLDDKIKAMIDQGYVPLKNEPGSAAGEFYRGPLMPLLQSQKEGSGVIGIKDHPAFQLGRLLCLQNRSISEAVFNNRISNLRTALLQKELNLKNAYEESDGVNEGSISGQMSLHELAELLKTFNSAKTPQI